MKPDDNEVLYFLYGELSAGILKIGIWNMEILEDSIQQTSDSVGK